MPAVGEKRFELRNCANISPAKMKADLRVVDGEALDPVARRDALGVCVGCVVVGVMGKKTCPSIATIEEGFVFTEIRPSIGNITSSNEGSTGVRA